VLCKDAQEAAPAMNGQKHRPREAARQRAGFFARLRSWLTSPSRTAVWSALKTSGKSRYLECDAGYYVDKIEGGAFEVCCRSTSSRSRVLLGSSEVACGSIDGLLEA
jgi:hypothetical protein